MGDLWRITIPYFRSADKWRGGGLLAAVIALQLFSVLLDVLFNKWNNTFYNALQNKDWQTFIWQLGVFSVLATLFIVTAVYQLYLSQWLQIRWRVWMTDHYLGKWLTRSAHYRMRLLGNPADNPDQRIADDIQMFISGTLSIGVGLLGSFVSLVSFVVILWGLSAATPLILFGQSYNIPGYLVWFALGYAIVGTWVTHLVGRPLIRLNFEQQRYEADFRFALVRVRENSEEIALLEGEPAENDRLRDRFSRVVTNWYAIMTRQKKLTFLTAGYSQIAIIFPFVVVSPLYFSGSMELGGLMQTASAFGQVQGALSFFVSAYTAIAGWKAVLDRLSGFENSIGRARALDANGPRIEAVGERLVAENLCSRPAQWRGDRARPRARGFGGRPPPRHRPDRFRQDQPLPRARRRLAVRHRHHRRAQGRARHGAAAARLPAARLAQGHTHLSQARGGLLDRRGRRSSQGRGPRAARPAPR